jgi:hypothetical protein
MRRTSARIAQAFAQNTSWQQQATAGLAVLLSALDADPCLARVCLVEALAAGPAALQYHAREIELLKHMVDSAAGQARTDRHSTALSAEATLRAAARPGRGAGVGDKDQRSSTRVAAEASAWRARPPCRATGVADIEKQRQRSWAGACAAGGRRAWRCDRPWEPRAGSANAAKLGERHDDDTIEHPAAWS